MSKVDSTTIVNFVGAGVTFLAKAIDAGVNAYRAKFVKALELLEWAYKEIARLNGVIHDYQDELDKLRGEKK